MVSICLSLSVFFCVWFLVVFKFSLSFSTVSICILSLGFCGLSWFVFYVSVFIGVSVVYLFLCFSLVYFVCFFLRFLDSLGLCVFF